MRRAQALDPLSLIINTEIGRLLYFSRQYDAAIAQHRKTLEMDPNFALAHLHLGAALLQKGSYAEALAEFEKAPAAGGPMPDVGRARAYALAGRRRESEEVLQVLLERSKQRIRPAVCDGVVLRRPCRITSAHSTGWRRVPRSGGAWFLKVHPAWDRLQSHPRYQAIVRSVGLVP